MLHFSKNCRSCLSPNVSTVTAQQTKEPESSANILTNHMLASIFELCFCTKSREISTVWLHIEDSLNAQPFLLCQENSKCKQNKKQHLPNLTQFTVIYFI